MALGKLWNAFFGKQTAAESDPPIVRDSQPLSQQPAESLSPEAQPVARPGASPAAAAPRPAVEQDRAATPVVTKVKRKAAGKRDKKPLPEAEPAVAPLAETPPPVRIVQPQTNAWTPLVRGRQISTILDTHLGDASQAVELLRAIVCDAAPTPKYVAIDLFELGSGPLTVSDFHQRIRRVGGQPVAVPADLCGGLRQLSQTLGTVDLVLLDGDGADLTQLEFRRLLDRVTHSDSLVLRRDASGKWQRVETVAAGRQRPQETQAKAA